MTSSTPSGTGQPAPEGPTGQDQESLEQGPRSQRSSRRTFTQVFKRAIVQDYYVAPEGFKGAVLRRERL